MSKKKLEPKEKSTAFVPPRLTGPRSIQTASGFRDRLGAGQEWWWYYQLLAFEMMEKYNFSLIHPASVDYTTAYTRSYGRNFPIVQDNLLTIMDPRHEHISLRPSMDVSFMRAYYLKHKQNFETGIPIESWYTIGSVFGEKYEPREKLQLFMSVLGNHHPVVDAECALAAYRYIQALGFLQVQLMINSIGSLESQQLYSQELTAYYREKRKELCEECTPYITKEPMRILTCEKEECRQVNSGAPQSVDWLVEDDKEHFIRVLEYLDELELPYVLSPELVPLNEYYKKTMIAVRVTTDDGTQYVLARGGRYDDVIADMVDVEIPAMNMIIDLDRCLTATRTQRLAIPEQRLPQVFLAQLGDDAKKKALPLREELHGAGIKTAEHFGHDSLKKQLEQAVEQKVKITCILGQKEILEGTILVRDMDGGIQEEIPINRLIGEIKKRLADS